MHLSRLLFPAWVVVASVSNLSARELIANVAAEIPGPDMEILEDKTGTLTISQITEPENLRRFRPDMRPIPYFGVTDSAIWVKLSLKSSEARSSWFIEIQEPLIHHIELYSQQGDGFEHQRSGRLSPFDTREIKHRKILFPILLSQSPTTFFLKFQSRDYLSVPIKLWPRREFFMGELTDQLALGLFYGIITALFLYNAFLFFSLKDHNYLYYVLYIASFSIFQSTIDGLFFQAMPISSVWLNWRAPIFSGLASGVFLLMFTKSFLALKDAPAWVTFLRRLLLGAIATLGALSLFDTSMPFASRYANVASLLTMLFAISIGVYRTTKGYRPARYFLAGWLVFLSGVIAASLVNLAVLPPSLLTKYWTKIGFIAELLLFSFALADRISLLQTQKDLADKRALESQQRMAIELEKQVQERTSELSKANATKDKFFSIIAHDLRGPVGSLAALFTEVIEDNGKLDSSLLQIIRKTTRTTQQLLEDLLTWSRSQLGEIEFRPETIRVNEIAQDTISLIEAQAISKGITLSLKAETDNVVRADASMTSLILRNLLSNAIKFTPEKGRVEVRLRGLGNAVELSVTDTGHGMPPERVDSLFRVGVRTSSTPGTNKEVGSGLGLILCKEFTERNGGRIGVESAPGKGSRFWFTLPAVDLEERARSAG
ncbi:MAG: sensor histidine kinase [Spirochaetia bacterium]|nr:sensor histidine kinase [Spirochaetia bacterium]